MSPGFDSRSRHLCAFGFQSKLASVGFLRVLRFSLLHLKLGFLDKSVSGISWRRPLNLMPLHYWDLPGLSPNVINIKKPKKNGTRSRKTNAADWLGQTCCLETSKQPVTYWVITINKKVTENYGRRRRSNEDPYDAGKCIFYCITL